MARLQTVETPLLSLQLLATVAWAVLVVKELGLELVALAVLAALQELPAQAATLRCLPLVLGRSRRILHRPMAARPSKSAAPAPPAARAAAVAPESLEPRAAMVEMEEIALMAEWLR